MELENRIQALIAVGAAVSANCQACLQSAIALARKNDVNEREIADAMQIGKRIRRGTASQMDAFASELPLAAASPATADTGCGCCLI